jgi:hypothetical protein
MAVAVPTARSAGGARGLSDAVCHCPSLDRTLPKVHAPIVEERHAGAHHADRALCPDRPICSCTHCDGGATTRPGRWPRHRQGANCSLRANSPSGRGHRAATRSCFSTRFDAPYTGPPARLDAITVPGGSRRTVVTAPSNGDGLSGTASWSWARTSTMRYRTLRHTDESLLPGATRRTVTAREVIDVAAVQRQRLA